MPACAQGQSRWQRLRTSAVAVAVALLAVITPARAADPVSALDAVASAGTLRVCTPGDYKPFSFQQPDGSFEGLDVDLMQSLAAALGVKLDWVKTSWKQLLPDFTAGKCDIAAGGISISLERQKQAGFSNGYLVNGKVPLVRCENRAKFQSVADIDKPDVKVIVNPGGSNERFARANFKQATVTVNPDNLTIFDEVLKGHADVFVTESAEAQIQQRQKPGLCAVNPEQPLQYGEMAYLLPRGDTAFKAFVDQWLHLAKASGEYQRLQEKWLR